VQTDILGFLEKFAIDPPEISQEENVEVVELFRWIRASLAMARSGADFKCELSAKVAARTLSAAVCRLLPAESSASSTGIVKAQLRLLRDSCFEWPSLHSLRPEALSAVPKNIAKNFAKYFHEKGRLLVDVELERMKDQVPLRVSQRFTFCYRLRLSTCLISLRFKRRQKSSLEASLVRLKPATCAAALPVAAKTEPLAMARAKMAGGKRMMRRRSARCDD